MPTQETSNFEVQITVSSEIGEISLEDMQVLVTQGIEWGGAYKVLSCSVTLKDWETSE